MMLLDTNTIIYYIFQKRPKVIQRARAYERSGRKYIMHPICYYEIVRWILGLQNLRERRRAMHTIRKFADERCVWVEIDEKVSQKAAYIWYQLRKLNELIEDADLFIAATALVYNYAVVTNNTAHFQRVPGLTIENWT